MAVPIVIVIGCVLIAVIIGLDIWWAADSISNNTWSEIIRTVAKRTPVVPFVCGVLSGHFFWPVAIKQYVPLFGQPGSIAILIWISCVIGIVGLALSKAGLCLPLWIAFVVGVAGGMLLWPVGRW